MITTNSADLASKTFDYVIAGGGTAGLTLAARLSEDPSVTVAVLEAGDNTIGEPKVRIPGQFGVTIADPKFDWTFFTKKQPLSNNREVLWSRGKGLGGSSAINFYAWVKPPAGDIDAFEKLGNPGWNWEEYLKYSKKSETFHPPAVEQTDVYAHSYNIDYRGTSGPIQVTVPPHVYTVDNLFQETMVNLGLKAIDDAYGGNTTGTWICSSNLDPKDWTRSYAATAYLPQGRPNLTILTHALVSRIVFADHVEGQDLTASGVEFIHNGNTHVVHAGKEVILSCGVVQSPQILELSGIGRPEILSKMGVDIKIDLPGVGENLQEHNLVATVFELNPVIKHETLDLLRDREYAQEAVRLYAEGKGMLRTGITSFAYLPISSVKSVEAENLIKQTEREIEEYKNTPGIAPGLREQLDIQLETLHDDTMPDFEITGFPGLFSLSLNPEPGKQYISLVALLNHPVSRGTIHAKSADPQDTPEIDPHYFEKDSDLENLVQQVKFMRRMAQTEPLKSGITGVEVLPGEGCTTDAQIRDYIKDNHRSAWHGIGTCSMLPREKQGVVDPQLKVYGTKNVRVVDISIVPIQIAAHTQATAYMIGEKAADLVRASHAL